MREEIILAHCAQLHGAVQDPTTACGDLLVAEAVDPVHELTFARCGKDRVRMRIAPAGDHIAAAGIDHREVAPVADAGEGAHGADRGDAAVLGAEPSIFYYRQLRHGRTAHARNARRESADQGFGVLDQEAMHRDKERQRHPPSAPTRRLPQCRGYDPAT